jgi:cytochrome c peroxidase
MRRHLVLLGSTALLSAAGCERSLGPESVLGPEEGVDVVAESGTLLDAELRNLLIASGEEQGVEFFRLPNEHQLHLIPQDPANPLTPRKVALGQRLFHETALGIDNVRSEGRETYSCASCHHAAAGFMANLPQGVAEGGSGFGARGEGRVFSPDYDGPEYPDCQPIRTPTTLNSAYQELMLWNGQFGGVGANLGTEGQWAIGTPLESNWLGLHGLETQAHAGLQVHRLLPIEDSRVPTLRRYRSLFRAAFPGQVDAINRLNAALAIAAYERTLLANRSPFQVWLRGQRHAMSIQEKRGAIVFFGRGGCVSCHTGPALSSMEFHALGMNDLDECYDPGRVNLGPFGGDVPDAVRRGRGGFTGRPEDDYAFKVPQLYNLLDSPFYGHGGSFRSIAEVVDYLNAGRPENPAVPAGLLAEEFVPLKLTPEERDDLVAFLEIGLYDPHLERYVPSQLPSGNCFPNNDPQSRIDLGCDLLTSARP